MSRTRIFAAFVLTFILAAAANDLNAIQLRACQHLDRSQNGRVAKSKRIKNDL